MAAALGASPAPGGAGSAPADSPGCTGTLSGDVQGTFACQAGFVDAEDGALVLVIQATGPVEKVAALAPGAFVVPRPPRPGTLTLDGLGPGRASVAVDGGALYTATRTSSQRGEVVLVLHTVRAAGQGWSAHGTYRARLVPAGGGRSGEVVVEVTF
jgi:hypothetical protein